ncbi:MAG: hypothetical protein FJ224_09405 [Lentisphaerae bacterium]|nr:hypothetical protein [Lentisphaerota bacterium]
MKATGLTALLLLLLGTGCASTRGYWMDRGRDAADMATVGLGSGFGAKARIGPIQTGLLLDLPWAGLRGGRLYETLTLPRDGMPYEADCQVLITGFEIFGGAGRGRGKTFMAAPDRVYGPFFHNATDESGNACKYYYTQMEAVAALGLSVRLGVNPGEILDFLVGWFGFDPYGDDLNSSRTEAGDPSY